MEHATAAPPLELATSGMGPEVFDFLGPHDYIHPDLDRDSFASCWKHQFFDGGPACVLVARDGAGRLIAHYGIMPVPYRIGGNPARAGFICQLFIDPAWRRSTLFWDLEGRTRRDFRAFGFDFLYGLITIKQVLTAHLRMGYSRGSDWHVYALPLAPGRGLAALRPGLPGVVQSAIDTAGTYAARTAFALRRPAAGRVRVDEVEEYSRIDWDFAASMGVGWKTCAEKGETAFRRRLAPFGRKRYRVFSAEADGKVRGYLALRTTRVRNFEVTAIIDVLAPAGDEAAWNALLAHAGRIGLESGSHAVTALARRGSAVARRLNSNLFFRTPSCFTLVYDVPDELRPAGETWLDEWGLSWFDHDYI